MIFPIFQMQRYILFLKRWKNYHNKVVSIDKSRARPEVSPLVVLRVVDLGFFGGGLSRVRRGRRR